MLLEKKHTEVKTISFPVAWSSLNEDSSNLKTQSNEGFKRLKKSVQEDGFKVKSMSSFTCCEIAYAYYYLEKEG